MNDLLLQFAEQENYNSIKWKEVSGRYVTLSDLKKLISSLKSNFEFEVIGRSVEERKIFATKIGNGPIRILAWSQMHGNESTTTKAIFDILALFSSNKKDYTIRDLLSKVTLYIIPILNPDGAKAYTRVNANHVDLNRDMQNLSQPESRVLRKTAENFKPHYCLNLHDQRTIFSAGLNDKTATISFLTPSKDEDRSIDDSRKESMRLIAGMANDLKSDLPEMIGRYDDGFNINCAGDTFQNMGIPTILFEAGHFPGDYKREKTRFFVFKALISCLQQIAFNSKNLPYERYFDISENDKLFRDVIIRNISKGDSMVDVVIQFKEVLKWGKIQFVPMIEKIGADIKEIGHREIDAKNETLKYPEESQLIENVVVNKIVLKSREIPIKME